MMAFTYKLDLYFMKMYLDIKNELSRTKPSKVMTKDDTSKFNTCACVMKSVQDTSVLNPSVQVEVQTVDHLFDVEKVNISTMHDKQHVTHSPSRLLDSSGIYLLAVQRSFSQTLTQNHNFSCWSRAPLNAL